MIAENRSKTLSILILAPAALAMDTVLTLPAVPATPAVPAVESAPNRRRLCADSDAGLKAALEANTLTAGYAAMVSGCSALPTLPMIGNGCTQEEFAADAELHCPLTCGVCTLSEEGLAPRTCTYHTADNKGDDFSDGPNSTNSTAHLLGCFEDGNTYSDGGRKWEGFNASRRVVDPSNTSTCECRDDPDYTDPKLSMPCGTIYRLYFLM